jgi:uncharacterized protein YndB with AHSA1/START domain
MRTPDVSKSVTVQVPVETAFRIFTERPADWLPPGHAFLPEPRTITIDPYAGGLFAERGPGGAEAVHGTVVEWAPPHRLVMTWRMGPNWRPTPDDTMASRIELAFTPAGPGATEVVLTHAGLDRHGDLAPRLHAALDGPSPGETLGNYATTVARDGE